MNMVQCAHIYSKKSRANATIARNHARCLNGLLASALAIAISTTPPRMAIESWSIRNGEELATLCKKAKVVSHLATILAVSLRLSCVKNSHNARPTANSTHGVIGLVNVLLVSPMDNKFLSKFVSARLQFKRMEVAVAHVKKECATFLGAVMNARSPPGPSGVPVFPLVLALIILALNIADGRFSVLHAHERHALHLMRPGHVLDVVQWIVRYLLGLAGFLVLPISVLGKNQMELLGSPSLVDLRPGRLNTLVPFYNNQMSVAFPALSLLKN